MEIGFLEIHWLDLIDVLLVTVLLYNLYKLVKGSVALKIFMGFLSIYLVFMIVKATEMALLSEILGQFMGVGVIAVIVLFQNEIRKLLLLIGKSAEFHDFWGRFFHHRKHEDDIFDVMPLIVAMKDMGVTKTGALIVVSRSNPLDFFAETGDMIDATLSKRLLLSIFYKNSPLHDGAAIVYKGKIKAARCILPVSENPDIPATLGLRHRAAVGMTELNNSLVLIVSEETGSLSLVYQGMIAHNLMPQEIRQKLLAYLRDEEFEMPHEFPFSETKETATEASA